MLESAATTLLTALDPLDFPARLRLLAAEALRLADEGDLDAVLDEYAAADAYQRELALMIAKITRRSDRLIGALNDPLFRLRALALFACVKIATPETDAAVLATLDDAPIAWRRKLTRAVSAAKRTDLADRLAESHCAELGEADTARLLPACSADVAARLLPGLVHHVPNWTRLGATHPGLVLDFARTELAATPPGSRPLWWARGFGRGIVAAAAQNPSRALDLLEEFPLPEGLPQPFLRRVHLLSRADVARTLRLLIGSDGRVADRWRLLTRSTRKNLAATGRPEVEAIGRAVQDNAAAFADLLRSLAPSARAAFYDTVTSDRESSKAILEPAVLDVLPRERRHAEARRMLGLSALADRPDERLAVVARLPWVEARSSLHEAVRRSDPDERAAAYPLLVSCAAAEDHPPTVTELLTTQLNRLRNEQDPVRRSALNALAAVPTHLFEDTAAVADALLALVTDALEARDCSWLTSNTLRLLASRILAHQAVASPDSRSGSGDLLIWALAAFEQLAGSSGSFNLDRLDRNLRRGQEFAVYRSLQPWLDRGIERADHRLVLALAYALGRRAQAVPELQDAIAHAIWHGTAVTARSAIDLWLADPARRDERVAEVVAWDPTAAAIHRVAELLSRRRTDLLDRYLTGTTAFTGRFIASGAIWVPNLRPSYRWLPRQQLAYARLLSKIAADQGARVQDRVAAINGLGAVPGEGQREVLRYLDAAEIPLAEAALKMLAWSEDPAATLPVLLSYADGDRARVAVYAATRAARFARPSAAAPILREVALSQSTKVTSRKEALRIAADLNTPGIVDLLEEVWRTPGQHRDVKAAAASRLASQMDDARVPALLREAVDDDPAVAIQLLRIHPLDMPERHRTTYGELIAAAVEISDPKTSRTALSAAPPWYRWTDSVATAVCTATTDVDRRGDRTAPPPALFALLAEGMPLARYQDVLHTLLTADAEDGNHDHDDDRDRPSRRRLVSIALAANAIGKLDPIQRRAILQATVQTLTDHPGYHRLVVDLAAGAVDLNVPADELVPEILELADRATGRRDAAARAGDRLGQKIARKEPWNPTAVLTAAEALAHRDEPESALVAVRLFNAAGAALGWPDPYPQAIKTLRHHPDPEVAEAALDVIIGAPAPGIRPALGRTM